jgi:hypothetical protein
MRSGYWAFLLFEFATQVKDLRGWGILAAVGNKIRTFGRCAFYALLLTCVLSSAAFADQPRARNTSASRSSSARKSVAHHTVSKKHRSASTVSDLSKANTTRTSRRTSTLRSSAARKRSSSRKKPAGVRGQQRIDPERAQAIQEALIREHYLSPDNAGPWNQASEDAMRRYQGDHGWQTKEVPDSRALIKLGLGPSKDGLLNPESAMTTVPDTPKSESSPTNSQSGLQTSPDSSPNRQ